MIILAFLAIWGIIAFFLYDYLEQNGLTDQPKYSNLSILNRVIYNCNQKEMNSPNLQILTAIFLHPYGWTFIIFTMILAFFTN